MLACKPPPGHARWSLKLLGEQLVELEIVDSISRETVRQTLKKKRTQALAEDMLVHSAESDGGLCLRHGGCARRLQRGL